MRFNIRNICFVLGAVFLSPSVIAADRFTLSGIIPGVTDSVMVTLVNKDADRHQRIGSVYTTDGRFTFSDTVAMPSMCELSMSRRGVKNKRFGKFASFRVMVENSDISVSFVATADSLASSDMPELLMKVNGSKAHDEFMHYLESCRDAERRVAEVSSMEARRYFETDDDEDTVAHYEHLKLLAADNLREAKRRFIADHPDYHISAHLILTELRRIFANTAGEMASMVEIAKACPDTARVNLIMRTYDKAMRYSLGQKYTDFEARDVKGQKHKFSELVTQGKYMLIDFWASWCLPCRMAIPHVKEIGERYAGRLDVCSVSLDKSDAAWLKALNKEDMPWIQLNVNPDDGKELFDAYLITAIPRLMLLDGDGCIVCSTNEPQVLDAYLDRHLTVGKD